MTYDSFFGRNSFIKIASLRSGYKITIETKDSTYIYQDGVLRHGREVIGKSKSRFAEIVSYHIPDTIIGVVLENTIADKIEIQSKKLDVYVRSSNISECQVKGWEHDSSSYLRRISLNGTNIGKLTLENCNVDKALGSSSELSGYDGQVNSVTISHCSIKSPYYLSDLLLPKALVLDYNEFKGNSFIDINHLVVGQLAPRCGLIILDSTGDAIPLRLKYEYFHLEFPHSTQISTKEFLYRNFLEEQKITGTEEGLEKLTKEYKSFENRKGETFLGKLQDTIEQGWWDYGYDKFKVISNSLRIFLLFILVNILIYPSLIKVYCPPKFDTLERTFRRKYGEAKTFRSGLRTRVLKIPSIVLYTGFIFWGLKLDLKEINLIKPVYLCILIIEYTVGIICLAYIANFILSR
jgi:hypothetical protein